MKRVDLEREVYIRKKNEERKLKKWCVSVEDDPYTHFPPPLLLNCARFQSVSLKNVVSGGGMNECFLLVLLRIIKARLKGKLNETKREREEEQAK